MPIAKTLYVGNLPWQTTDEELTNFFSPVGSVQTVQIIKDRETGRSRGFGFVTMENADAAMQELNGKDLGGRALRINEATEKKERGNSNYQSSSNNGGFPTRPQSDRDRSRNFGRSKDKSYSSY